MIAGTVAVAELVAWRVGAAGERTRDSGPVVLLDFRPARQPARRDAHSRGAPRARIPCIRTRAVLYCTNLS